MKRIFNFISAALLLVTIACCTNELDNDPIGLLTEEQVDSNPTTETIESSVTRLPAPEKYPERHNSRLAMGFGHDI